MDFLESGAQSGGYLESGRPPEDLQDFSLGTTGSPNRVGLPSPQQGMTNRFYSIDFE